VASAQTGASIGGTVKDASGAVLPGVTVEASSPSLIEKTRSTTTDGNGQYQLDRLRPGTYSVTFSLAGFTSLRREAIALSGTFAATVNAQLNISTVTETVTVRGEPPLIDLRSAAKQNVLDADVLASIPTARTMVTAAVLIPGVTLSTPDVGGTNALPGGGGQLAIHGGQTSDFRQMIDGVSTANAVSAGAFSQILPNMAAAQEITVDVSSGSAEYSSAGVIANMIPREGGNRFSGTFFGTAVNGSFQGSNVTTDLLNRGLKTLPSIKVLYDFNPGVGGPLAQDKLWFFAAGRWARTSNYTGSGVYYNKNAGNPHSWTYDPDLTRPVYNDVDSNGQNLRLTWQANQRNKFAAYYDSQRKCMCPGYLFGLTSPEAADTLHYPVNDMLTTSWTSAVTNRLLVEVRSGLRRERFHFDQPDTLRLTNVIEQGGIVPGLNYRGGGLATQGQPFGSTFNINWSTSGSLSYDTGRHRFKAGVTNSYLQYDASYSDNDSHLTYRFLNGVPNQLIERATPYIAKNRRPWELGIYAQDQWALQRLTLNLGVRFDYLDSYSAAEQLGPGLLVPTRNLSFPETPLASWTDVVPRLAGVYDLFGNGRTAIRLSVNKYVGYLGLGGFGAGAPDPVSSLALNVTRSWSDTNGNFNPDCDVTNPLGQDLRASGGDVCGAVSDTNFGKSTPSSRPDPGLFFGWGRRPYQWEFSASVDQQLHPRVSATVGFFRRWYGNLIATDNLALSPSDFSPFTVVAPTDPRLPGGGGYSIGPLYDRNPNTVNVPSNNFITFADSYGNQIQRWSGVDATLSARIRGQLIVQGGLSTGRTLTDNCEVLAKLPEMSPLSVPYCHVEQPFQTQIKLLGTYTLQKGGVQLSAAFQSVPGPSLAANQVVSNASVRTALGRDLSGGAANVTVPLLAQGSQYGDRLNQLDVRASKILKYGRTKTSLNIDVYNALNVSAILTENAAYVNSSATGWRVPTSIVSARFAKLSIQFDF
jgi:hypothetical protein